MSVKMRNILIRIASLTACGGSICGVFDGSLYVLQFFPISGSLVPRRAAFLVPVTPYNTISIPRLVFLTGQMGVTPILRVSQTYSVM
jgi:hypothetical protein